MYLLVGNSKTVNNAPLHATHSLYTYSSSLSFPTFTVYSSSNYFVDVVFVRQSFLHHCCPPRYLHPHLHLIVPSIISQHLSIPSGYSSSGSPMLVPTPGLSRSPSARPTRKSSSRPTAHHFTPFQYPKCTALAHRKSNYKTYWQSFLGSVHDCKCCFNR
jgi:hypothetical protein